RIEVERFDRRRAVREARRRAEPRARRIAVRRIAADDLPQVGRVLALVVSVVELLLVQVEPDLRSGRKRCARGEAERVARTCAQHVAPGAHRPASTSPSATTAGSACTQRILRLAVSAPNTPAISTQTRKN